MKPATLALALSGVTALACVALPPRLPPGSDPANPHAPEAPPLAAATVLKSDPPPAASLQAPPAESGMQMGHEQMQMQSDDHERMQPKEDGGMRHEIDAGMQHDHGQMHDGGTGPRDAGSTMPDHRQHQGAQPATPVEARDGGSP